MKITCRVKCLANAAILAIVVCFYGSSAAVTPSNHGENPGNTPLMISAYKGDTAEMRRMLQAGADIRQTNDYGFNALMFAAGAYPAQPVRPKGSVDAIRLLIQLGADPNARTHRGMTALMFAVQYGDLKYVELLLEHGADVNLINVDGESALSFAAFKGDPELVGALLKAHARPNGYADLNGRTPLLGALAAAPPSLPFSARSLRENMDAALKSAQYHKVTMLLLDGGADVNTRDRNGETSLGLAVEAGSLPTVRGLLDHGANVDAPTQLNRTPLIRSVAGGQRGITELLVKRGAKLNARDELGKTALGYALEGTSPAVVEFLRSAGARQ